MKTQLLCLVAGIAMLSCSKTIQDEITVPQENGTSLPENFNFKTTSLQSFSVSSQDNDGKSMSNIPINVYGIDENGKYLMATGATNNQGEYMFQNELGNHLDSISVETNYIGLNAINTYALHDMNNVLLGGVSDYQKQGVITNDADDARSSATQSSNADGYTFLDDYDNNGVPYYLEPQDDYISQDLLDLINNSLPEGYPVPTYNPEYIVDSVSSDTKLRDSAEVWVTFVHEGAGWRNTLGYYTYDMNNPPQSVDDIEKLNIIFPNVSFNGSGGGMASGNKVFLGNFPGNIGIGWFLIPDAWRGGQVTERSQIKYSNKDFNTFTAKDYRTHTVLLKDNTRELLLLGMEDTSRPGGDNDFNDAVFYVTANPFSSVITDDLNETTTDEAADSDGDGVADRNDNYPDDPDKAFDIFTPGENVFGSLAFEDLYPSKGDFDMNDLVIEYNFQSIANVSNKIVEIRAKFNLKALGAMIHSGFGFTLPIDPSLIESVTGQDIETNDQMVISSNGTESGQSEAVIILFEDGFRVWDGAFIQTNTIPGNGYLTPMEFELSIKFTEPISNLSLGYVPYSPFIFHSEDRSVEVHLVDDVPTDKASFVFSGTWGPDDRKADNNYKTYDNLPYAINLPVSFDYPIEGVSMSESFNHFETWAQSLNTSYKDWYQDKGGYRINNKIYVKD